MSGIDPKEAAIMFTEGYRAGLEAAAKACDSNRAKALALSESMEQSDPISAEALDCAAGVHFADACCIRALLPKETEAGK